jgi:type IV pilus assembly protein PilM
MAKTTGVWGIDIGRCALKALRCRLDGDSVVADAFDYIEYPKLLSQPEADPAQLIKEALEQFLSRNTVKGDRVAISVSGESGLARYFKPPPVDAKKIADLVKFEARQQIPFALEDVIWDYQRMAGGQEVDGFVLDSEIGLFAMKREQVAKALAPFKSAGIEVDIIQLAPISAYNYITYDFLKPLAEGEDYNSEAPPPSTVILSIGTDTTDLVITNGYRVWQRNIPLGGNHFTKQLSKDLKLTFAKAEHLKRNPRQADDPKAIFQAMRPVFGDLVTEVQRSVGFFQSLDRKAKITSVVLLGNTVKLPGLGQYLSKHLGYDVKEVDSFNKLTGSGVVSAPAFKDNVLTFGTCYGLCLQALGKGKLSTNLLPREIMTERMIRAKKPWAVAALAALTLGLGLNYVFWYRTVDEVHPETEVLNVSWKSAMDEVQSVVGTSTKLQNDDKAKQALYDKIHKFSNEVVGTNDRRVMWLELLHVIHLGLPMTEGVPPNTVPDPKVVPFSKRRELHIEYVETQFFDDLNTWWTQPMVKQRYVEANPHLKTDSAAGGAAPAAQPATPSPAATQTMGPSAMGPSAMAGMGGGAQANSGALDVSSVNVAGPKDKGWVVELKGYHYFNDRENYWQGGANHVKATLMNWLENGQVELPTPQGPMVFTMDELGIGYVILVRDPRTQTVYLENPNYEPDPDDALPGAGVGGFGNGNPMGAKAAKKTEQDPDNPAFYEAEKYEFIVQFVWQEKPLNERLEERAKKAAAAAGAAAQPAALGTTGAATQAVPTTPTPAAPNPGTPAPTPATPTQPTPTTPAPTPGTPTPSSGPAAAAPSSAPATPPGTAPPATNSDGAVPSGAAPPAAAPPASAPPAQG